VISPAVLGFLILFNARKMCSLRQRLQIRNLLHRWFHHLKELTKLNCAMSVPARGQRERGMSPRARRQQLDKHVPYCLRPVLSSFANQSVRTLESLGPSTFISQLSLARDPTMDTRHFPPPHSAHVRHRQESRCAFESHPYFASRPSLPCLLILYKVTSNHFLSKTG